MLLLEVLWLKIRYCLEVVRFPSHAMVVRTRFGAADEVEGVMYYEIWVTEDILGGWCD